MSGGASSDWMLQFLGGVAPEQRASSGAASSQSTQPTQMPQQPGREMSCKEMMELKQQQDAIGSNLPGDMSCKDLLSNFFAQGQSGQAEPGELRVDSTDGKLYPQQSFIDVYGGTNEWDNAEPERRLDPADGKCYTKKGFIDQYGGTQEWDAAEQRLDTTDGLGYTKQAFIDQYGGTNEWDAAMRWNPAKSTRPPAAPMMPPAPMLPPAPMMPPAPMVPPAPIIDSTPQPSQQGGADASQQPEQAGIDWSSMSEQDQQVYLETLKAHQAMQEQRLQFEQQMRLEDTMQKSDSEKKKECRFVDDYRPTSLCKHMKQKGHCVHEGKCYFAHSYDELHAVSPELDEIAGGNSHADWARRPGDEGWTRPDLKMRKKKGLCPHYAQGGCKLGKICGFAHGEEELGKVGLAVLGFVKTQICQNWTKGVCKFGKHCERAHGEQEIGHKRPPPDLWLTAANKRPKHLPTFKTELASITPAQRKEYDAHLEKLEGIRQTARMMTLHWDSCGVAVFTEDR